ncbi:hypothetical protein Scep_021388 [Stephania cephalantha]|uniref:Mannose-1-phosphate guanylyltransferase n=1 Tax=Stephania cephalantha TaxID=152367 RepID=A0AAP0FDI7_9MAGN
MGVTEVILAINYQPEAMARFLKDYESKLGMKITCSQETEPLGTAGPLALVKDKLIDESGSPFFVLNSDVICEFPLEKMIKFHKAHGGEASIMVTKVDEPSKYGVVVMEETTGKVERFMEKPKSFVGFWMDIGQPRYYITGLGLYLDSLRNKGSSKLSSGSHIHGNVLIEESAVIEGDCVFGPNVAIGPECVVEEGVTLSRCTVMRGARINKHACISNCIIGWNSTVGQGACIEDMIILGDDVYGYDKISCNGRVPPS